MTELTTPKLNAESHLLLDQPLLRVPYEVCRKNFKAAQRHIERDRDWVLSSIGSPSQVISSNGSNDGGSNTITSLDGIITRVEGLKRKLESLHEEEKILHRQSRKRIEHLGELYDMSTLADVKYENWSKIRLNRLLVDYLLRNGYGESAKALAREENVEDLVDVDAFVQCHRIEESLRRGRTQECLMWCADNKQSLKRMNSNLEFELRLQQFVELARTGRTEKLLEATTHARKHLSSSSDTVHAIRAAGLLAFSPDTQLEPYKTMYSFARWNTLATLFTKTHHELLSLPPTPHLHVALSAGLSALKTPSCHSQHISPSANANATSIPSSAATGTGTSSTTTSSSSSVGTSVCPICSTELNELARSVPYAHHSKSIVEHDPVVLPNGRIYGRERLERWNEKMGMPVGCGRLRDPTDPTIIFAESEVVKVYIS